MDYPRLIPETMTHYYFYVMAGDVCDNLTEVFKVAIGQSIQGERDFEYLKQIALQRNYYFSIVCAESQIFIDNLIDSLAEFDTQVKHVTSRDLVRRMKTMVAEPLNQSKLAGAAYQLKQLDTSYRIISNLNRRAAQTAKRVK